MEVIRTSVISERGEVTLPSEFLEKYGLKQGDEVSFVTTTNGLKVMPPTDAVMRLLDEVGDELRNKDVTLEELMESSEQIRQDIYNERYGVDDRKHG